MTVEPALARLAVTPAPAHARAQVAMKAAPTRETFMKKLVEGGGGSDDEVMAGLGSINSKFNAIVIGIDAYLKEKGIEK